MSLFGSLNVGYRGLSASQLAMNVTGQNITNANTEGYSRKRVSVSSDARKDDAFGQMGNGVSVDQVHRFRNRFIDDQINSEVATEGYYKTLDDAYERIENIFTEPTDNGLNKYLDTFWNSWQDLANNPADLSARELVKTNSEVLTNQFHNLSEQLRDYKLSINGMVGSEIEQINNTIREISILNEEIATVEVQDGNRANDSRDNRTLKLRQLAEKIDIDFYEDPDGRITVTTAGSIIVGPKNVNELELFRKSIRENDGFTYSEIYVRFENTKAEYNPRDGALKGLFQVRDEEIKGFEADLDDMAETLVKEVNAVHYTGYDLDTDTGLHFFDPEKVNAKNISVSEDILLNSKNIAAAKGGSIADPVGLPLPGTVPAGTRRIDFTDGTADPLYDSRYRDWLEGSVTVTLGGVPLREGVGQDFSVDYQSGSIYFNSAVTVPGGSVVSVEFQYNDSPFGGVGDGSNALEIAQMKDKFTMKQDVAGNATQTIGEFYSAFIGKLGIDRNEATSNYETRRYIIEQLDKRTQELSGVSLDEEMANMIKFEHTYQASARYIGVIDEMMDVLLNL